jgi:hypothetical protein
MWAPPALALRGAPTTIYPLRAALSLAPQETADPSARTTSRGVCGVYRCRVILTSAETAEVLKVEVCTLRQWIRRRKLTPVPGTRPHEFWAKDVYDLQVARRTPVQIAWHDALWAEYDRILADQH